MVQDIIDALTGWMPTGIQHTVEILLYMAILGALAVTPLILWLIYVTAFPAKKRT